MFWRKKSDGFEWHKYVRTTIKLRREDRRRRIDEIKHAAAEGIVGAGKASVSAGASGLDTIGRAMTSPLRWFARMVRDGWSYLARRCGPMLRAPMLPTALLLEHDRFSLAVAGTAAASTLLAVTSILVWGWTWLAFLMLAVAVIAAGVLVVPPLTTGRGPQWIASARTMLHAVVERIPRKRIAQLPFHRGVGLAGLVATVAIAVWLALGTVVRLPGPSLASMSGLSAPVLKGTAVALSGDSVRISGQVVRLSGIDAPEYNQRCSAPNGRRGRSRNWNCAAAAKQSLARLVRRETVECRLQSRVDGRQLARCTADGKDLAAELVRQGHVFAEPGVFSTYGRLEQDARNEKLGIWRGTAERPTDFRARLWARAKRRAPDGCPIKGRVASGQRLYVTPWSPYYGRTRVSERRGGRWFCSEEEALAAGWQPGDRS
ncbi:MAG: thermonuclease family protein [Hyphomicrobiaceae bacterium]